MQNVSTPCGWTGRVAERLGQEQLTFEFLFAKHVNETIMSSKVTIRQARRIHLLGSGCTRGDQDGVGEARDIVKEFQKGKGVSLMLSNANKPRRHTRKGERLAMLCFRIQETQ